MAAPSAQFSSYSSSISLYTILTIIFCCLAGLSLILLRVLYSVLLVKRMTKTIIGLQSCAEILTDSLLSATEYSIIAILRGGVSMDDVYADYDRVIRARKSEVARVFGADHTTTRFVKCYDSNAVTRRK